MTGHLHALVQQLHFGLLAGKPFYFVQLYLMPDYTIPFVDVRSCRNHFPGILRAPGDM